MSEYSSTETTVAASVAGLAAVIMPIAVLAGCLLGFAVDWGMSLSWIPVDGPFRLLRSIPSPYDILLPTGIGLVGGFVLLLLAVDDRMVVRVSEYRVEARRRSFVRELSRYSVGAVFLEEKQLVIQDRQGGERVRLRIDNDQRANLEKAFVAHGYRWRDDGDPYRDQFRRWVPGMPELPAGADPLLRAREKALGNGDAADIAELHGELARLGVAVREQEKRQYWRPQSAEE